MWKCAFYSYWLKGNSVYCKNMASPADRPREKLAVNSRTWLPIVPSKVDVQHCEEEYLVKFDWQSCDSMGKINLVGC